MLPQLDVDASVGKAQVQQPLPPSLPPHSTAPPPSHQLPHVLPQLDVDAPVCKAQVQQPLRATLVAALQRRLPRVALKATQRGLVVCA